MIQMIWSIVLTGHAVLAAVWLWISPGGFPSTTTEYWLNSVLPWVPIALVLLGLFARGRAAQILVPPIFAVFPAFWMAFAISWRLAFPEGGGAWNLPFAGGFVLAILWLRQYRGNWPNPILTLLFVAPALYAGWWLPPTQRAPAPATRPAGAPLAEPAGGSTIPKILKLGKDAQLHSDDGRLVVRRDQLVLTVQPLLAFADRSPDRGSVDPEDKVATVRKLTGWTQKGMHASLEYKDEDRSTLEVEAKEGAYELEARSRLSQPLYSHANRFAEITIRGHKKLSVSFSVQPGRRVELPPTTSPTRFAYVDTAAVLHVVDAHKLNEGPFTEILSGPLPGDGALELVLYDGDQPVFRVALLDWAPQASTQRSQVAGWGVPENAIELVRGGAADDAPAAITLSLAETLVGRGRRTVGHAAGVYRDRVTVTAVR